MNRMWWGLLGVAVLASQTGCRNSCGERRFHLFNRDRDDTMIGRLTGSRDAAPCPTGAFASQLGYPAGAPIYDGLPVIPGPSSPMAPAGDPPNIPPTYLPATPVPAVPSAKNVLPPPKELAPPVGVTGYGK